MINDWQLLADSWFKTASEAMGHLEDAHLRLDFKTGSGPDTDTSFIIGNVPRDNI